MARHSEPGAFLRAQRARLRPRDVGLAPDAVPRRSARRLGPSGRWSTVQLIESWTDQPAMILGRRRDVLGINALARALIFDFTMLPVAERNYIRWILLDPTARELYRDWETVASEIATGTSLWVTSSSSGRA